MAGTRAVEPTRDVRPGIANPGEDPTRFGLVVLVGGPVLFLAGRARYA